jgi:hypothetical protein
MPQYKPGPWEFGENPQGSFTNELVVRPAGEFPHGDWIADCGPSAQEQRIANGRLIAAAPELLEVLQLAVQTAGDASWAPQARAAIKKALG